MKSPLKIAFTVVIIAGLVALFGFWFRSGHTRDDLASFAEMTQIGTNMSVPHDIEHQIYFKGEGAARKAADRISDNWRKTKVEPSKSDEGPWRLTVTRFMLPKLDDIAADSKKLRRISEQEHGKYAGWGSKTVQ